MVQCRGKRRSGTVGSVCLVPAERKRVSLTVRSESLFSASSQVRRRHAKAKFLLKGNLINRQQSRFILATGGGQWEIGVGRHGPGVKPIRRSGRRPSTYRPLTSKTRCVHRADII